MVGTDAEHASYMQKRLDRHMPTHYKNCSRMTSGKLMHWYYHGLTVRKYCRMSEHLQRIQTASNFWVGLDKGR